MILIIALIVVTVAYSVAAITKAKKLPDSISAMVYAFGKAGRWTWTAWIFLCAFLIMPPLIEAMPDNVRFLAFFMAASLAFCGAMPLMMNEKNTGHYVCGILAGIFSQICVAIICHWCLLWWLLLLIIPFCDKKWYLPGLPMWMINSRLFIIESICWLTTISALLNTYLIHT